MEDFKNCFIPLIEQCNSSETLASLVKSFYKYVKPEGCDEFSIAISNKTTTEYPECLKTDIFWNRNNILGTN